MRNLLLIATATAALTIAASFGASLAHAATSAPAAPASATLDADHIDDNDDTRVEVQLIVAGIAAFTVVGVGSAAYFLRKRLGLVAPPPGEGASSHH